MDPSPHPKSRSVEGMSEIRHLTHDIYDMDYYLNVCGGFEEYVAGSAAPRLIRAFDYGQVKEGMKVLDVGCGRGELAVRCAAAGCQVWAIDYSEDSIAIAKANMRERASPDNQRLIKIQRMNAKSLAFPSDFFDRVFLIDIVEHLYPEELEMAMREVKRVTKPGGRVVVHTAPNAWLIQPIYFIAGLVFHWKRHPWHVNEQSFFGLHRIMSSIGRDKEVHISKESGFFKLGVGPQTDPSSLVGRIARIMDGIFDSPPVTSLIRNSPLQLLLGTNLWASATLPVAGQKAEINRNS